MQYLFLSLAIVSELIGTTLLKLTNGFSVLLPSIGTVVFYIMSFYFLSQTLKTMDISIAYAIWCAVGISAIAIIGMLFFHELISVQKIISLFFIVIGVIGLNLSCAGH